MNAGPSISAPEDNNMASDSDTNPDDNPDYYQPISAVDVDDDGDEGSDQANSDEEHLSYHAHQTENGLSSLHLDGDSEGKSSGEEEEDEQERMREASDSAISRAFTEDESRRNAPLTAENAMRVMEAMRGVSFRGLAPDWAGRIPEDQWIDRLRRLRQLPPPTLAAGVQD